MLIMLLKLHIWDIMGLVSGQLLLATALSREGGSLDTRARLLQYCLNGFEVWSKKPIKIRKYQGRASMEGVVK